MQLFDTHCHIYEPNYQLPVPQVEDRARQAGVEYLLCVGVDQTTSKQAIDFAQNRPNCWASIGLHPHGSKGGAAALASLRPLVLAPKVVAIGECGLDYFYQNSSKKAQQTALRWQIELALEHNLPLIFHVRDAFDDFWPIFDSYQNLRGVLHSYTDTQNNLEKALSRGLYIGLNGIMTFTKNQWQLEVAKAVPLQRLLLETDAPFLTPHPFRGTVNEPAHVRVVAEFLSQLRGESVQQIARSTTRNAHSLFNTKILKTSQSKRI